MPKFLHKVWRGRVNKLFRSYGVSTPSSLGTRTDWTHKKLWPYARLFGFASTSIAEWNLFRSLSVEKARETGRRQLLLVPFFSVWCFFATSPPMLTTTPTLIAGVEHNSRVQSWSAEWNESFAILCNRYYCSHTRQNLILTSEGMKKINEIANSIGSKKSSSGRHGILSLGFIRWRF